MKKYLYILLLVLLSLTSCTYERHDLENYNTDTNAVSLRQLLTGYDLWYVDIDQTQGTGNIPFISRAFTMTFDYSGNVWANNNIAGVGFTGDGYGIKTGTFYVENGSNFVEINDDLDGIADFQVRQISNNEIELFNARQNVTYLLVGYQKRDFDYDALFYNNIVYFLQDYSYWKKTGGNMISPAVFDDENFLQFYVDNQGYNRFDTSLDNLSVTSGIVWDYEGDYQVNDTSNNTLKRLILSYDNGSTERFRLEIIDDENIRLTGLNTGNIYDFTGKDYIQYKPRPRKKKENTAYKKMKYFKSNKNTLRKRKI